MKKFILFLLFAICTINLSKAQVIDLIGTGTFGESSSNLPLIDIFNIDSVKVGAIYKSGPTVPSFSGVEFWDSDELRKSFWNNIRGNNLGYFGRTFYTSDDGGVHADIKIDNVHSFYAFIYRRNTLTTLFKSYIDTTTVFMYHNGSANAKKYIVPINTDSNSRNIVVKIPITELDDTGRSAIIDIHAGSESLHVEENTYNFGNSFFLGEYTLNNVPGNVSEVEISIYSPDPDEGEENGDSFFVSGIVVNVDKVFDGCTLTQGYWKNHSTCKTNGNGPKRDDTWDNLPNAEETIFFLSEQNYCEVYDTNPGKRGKYYILAHQYIAAELNLFSNSDPTDIVYAFNEATKLLLKYTPSDVDGNKNVENKFVELGSVLDEYNNGQIGPGHCDDDSPVLSVSEENKINGYSIYPNPARSKSSIVFVANQSSNTIVSMYSITGLKVGVLFEKETLKGQKVNIEFNPNRFKPGLYIVNIKNGSSSVSEKLIISN